LAAKKSPRPPVAFAAIVIDPNEAFESAARRIVTAQKVKTRGERIRRLEIYVFPTLGPMSVSAMMTSSRVWRRDRRSIPSSGA
jgi:hypothetical protein